jgi:hypothetical protein
VEGARRKNGLKNLVDCRVVTTISGPLAIQWWLAYKEETPIVATTQNKGFTPLASGAIAGFAALAGRGTYGYLNGQPTLLSLLAWLGSEWATAAIMSRPHSDPTNKAMAAIFGIPFGMIILLQLGWTIYLFLFYTPPLR